MTTCPIPGCPNTKAYTQIMCRAHWKQVPRAIREQVWNEFLIAPRSPEHYEAIKAAFKSVLHR